MTISLENAKKIWKAARKKKIKLPESEWWWIKFEGKFMLMTDINKLSNYFLDGDSVASWMEAGVLEHYGFIRGAWQDENIGYPAFPAYTTDELLEWLPDSLTPPRYNLKASLKIEKVGKNEYGAYYDVGWFVFKAKTPADALCKLAIKLIEEGVIK